MRLYLLITTTAISIVTHVAAFPHPDQQHVNRQSVNCTDLQASTDPSCWQGLQLTQWLTNWNKTTLVCPPNQDDANCCLSTEPWTTCFLRLARNNGDCSQINIQSCSWNSFLSVNNDIAPEVFYIMKNIYSLNNFFTNWYLALQFAISQAQLIIGSVVQLVDPDQSTNLVLGEILTALTAGLAFIAAPEVDAAEFAIDAATVSASEALITGLQQAPGVAKAIWPTGTLSTQVIQMAALDSQLDQLDGQASEMINAGLVLLMSDVPSFVAFVQSGSFSGANPYSLPSTVSGLDLGLKTFIVSTAIGQNVNLKNAIVGPICTVTYVDDNTVDPGSTQTPVGCILETAINHGNYLYNDATLSCDTNSICTWTTTNQEFWNGSTIATSQAYLLADIANGYLGTIVSNGWTSMELLFDGAYKCAQAGNFGGLPINFGAGGTVDTTCMSRMPECYSAGVNCPVALIGGNCPFKVCPPSS